MSQVRLFQGQTVLEDDRRLCEYSLTEGTTISALFEPGVDNTIEVSIGHKTQKLTVSNSTSTLALKVQISDVMRCGTREAGDQTGRRYTRGCDAAAFLRNQGWIKTRCHKTVCRSNHTKQPWSHLVLVT